MFIEAPAATVSMEKGAILLQGSLRNVNTDIVYNGVSLIPPSEHAGVPDYYEADCEENVIYLEYLYRNFELLGSETPRSGTSYATSNKIRKRRMSVGVDTTSFKSLVQKHIATGSLSRAVP